MTVTLYEHGETCDKYFEIKSNL